ncbi:zinc finger A20 and AN1 domain-containing stress-associated protein 8-like [Primulina huaijiensis]|uniref:zinc finger A20 and AN1 domain-containing stress-associated protein 8-like n=1 Tax=Primulina huaijiensis TaxID=1492673 RepID=UPI003CC705AC
MESSKETGCQVPEGPILCINNCGFFGSAATMNMCSKCHKDMVLQQQQASLAASSIENIVNGSSSTVNEKEPVLADMLNTEAGAVELKATFSESSSELMSSKSSDTKAVEGPKRCTSCRKRVGLTGFSCKCGHLFCSVHRYSDKHDCQFDYRTAAQDAIAKANPLVKGEKLEKI